MPFPSTLAPESIQGLKPRTTYLPAEKIKTSWSAKIKDAALFSARTTNTTYLKQLKEKLAQVADRGTNPIQAQDALQSSLSMLGYTPQHGFAGDAHRYGASSIPPATPGSITDLSSAGRIRLIIETNVKQARSMAQKATSQDPVFLMTNPAWRLERTGARKVPRKDWVARWQAAGNSVGWEGALKHDFVALKDSPIWQAIGDGTGDFEDTLGTDYPPFAFGSGMAWTNVGRREWKRLCADEGVPDGLDELADRAAAMQEAQDAAGDAQEAPGALGGVQGGQGQGERTGGDQEAPVPVFHPDLSARTATEDAIKAAGLKVDAAKAKIQAMMQDIVAAVDEAKAAATGYDEAVDKDDVIKQGDSLAANAGTEYSACDGLKAMLGKWSDMAVAIPVPTDDTTQQDFDRQAELIRKAAESVDGHEQVGRAKAALDAARQMVQDTKDKVAAWIQAKLDGLYQQGEAWDQEIRTHQRITEYSAEIAAAKKTAKAQFKPKKGK